MLVILTSGKNSAIVHYVCESSTPTVRGVKAESYKIRCLMVGKLTKVCFQHPYQQRTDFFMKTLNKKFQINYLIIPEIIFNNPKITYTAAKIYAFIHNFKMEEFFYGNERIMDLFNCSEDAVSRAIKSLEEEGYITTRFDGRKRFIEDSLRLRKFSDAESAKERMLNKAGDSERMRMLNEASTAGLIRKDNKKDYENFLPIRKEDRKPKVGFGRIQESRQPYKNGFSVTKPRIGKSAEGVK